MARGVVWVVDGGWQMADGGQMTTAWLGSTTRRRSEGRATANQHGASSCLSAISGSWTLSRALPESVSRPLPLLSRHSIDVGKWYRATGGALTGT